MHYRNRLVFACSVAGTLVMVATASYFLLFDSGAPRNLWDAALALALPCAVVWVLIRVGLTPYVQWGGDSPSATHLSSTMRPFLMSDCLAGRNRAVSLKSEGSARLHLGH